MRKVLLIAGITLLITAVFAEQIGIDNDEGWGAGRLIILISGLAVILSDILSILYQEQFAKLIKYISAYRHLFAAVVIVSIVYVWLAQLNLKHTQKNFKYYSELARSFKSGHLYLAEEPSPALLSLSNPYNYDLRLESKVEDFPWDVSLYNKKFYVYWGPAPSLILTIFSNQQLSQIGDRHLVLGFAFGLFLYAVLIVMRFFEKSLPNAPGWLLGVSVLTLGLTAPATIMLKESRVYEASIFGCQFFFIGGCYWAYSSISDSKPVVWKLALAGLHWVFSFGTRITILPAVLYSATATIIYILIVFKITSLGKIVPTALAIGASLLLGVSVSGWYNWARFDSIFEFGLKYQLTNTDYNVFQDSFSTSHIANNIYLYFAHPLKIHPWFPFLFRIEYPYTNERLGGLIFIAPFILLVFSPLVSMAGKYLSVKKEAGSEGFANPSEKWLITMFSGSALISMVVTLSFWFTTMRYIEDFMPSLLLLTTIIVGRAHRTSGINLVQKDVFAVITITLATITITAGALVALQSDSMIFWVNFVNSMLNILQLK